MTSRKEIMTRLRRKVEIVRLDMKAVGDPHYRDCNDILTLLDVLERENAKPY